MEIRVRAAAKQVARASREAECEDRGTRECEGNWIARAQSRGHDKNQNGEKEEFHKSRSLVCDRGRFAVTGFVPEICNCF